LGWLYLTLNPTAAAYPSAVDLFRTGANLGDSDAMLSLAEMIIRKRATPLNSGETPIALITRAAQLGNKSASDELLQIKSELENQQHNALTQQQTEEMMRNFLGTILQHIGR
jgi:hypothetical protein